MIPDLTRARRIAVTSWGAVLLTTSVGLGVLAADAPVTATRPADTSNQLDPQDRTVPDMLSAQQNQYHALRDQYWNRPQVPHGLPGPSAPPSARASGVAAVSLQARNIDFYLDEGIGYHIKNLQAQLVPVRAGEPVNFDDPEQYRIHILSGEVLIRPQNLDALFNNYVLTYAPRALSSVENHTSDNRLTVSVGARLFRFLPPVGALPTTLSGPIKLAENNWLVYTPQSVKSLGLPLKPLLSLSHLTLATLTPLERPGIKLEGNQLLMDPEHLFPPPALQIDRISEVRLSDQGLSLKFTSDVPNAGFKPLPVPAESYLWLQSGDARFYGTLLVNANLEVLSDSKQPLDFFLYHYRAQSAAGSIHTREDGALIVRVPNQFETTDAAPVQTTAAPPRPHPLRSRKTDAATAPENAAQAPAP